MSRKLIPLTESLIAELDKSKDKSKKTNEDSFGKKTKNVNDQAKNNRDKGELNRAVVKKVRKCKTIEQQKKRKQKMQKTCREPLDVDCDSSIDTIDKQMITKSRSLFNVVVSQTNSDQNSITTYDSGSITSLIDESGNICDERVIEGNRIKIYKCPGQKLFAKFSGSDDSSDECCDPDSIKMKRQKSCKGRVNLKNPKLKVFAPLKVQTQASVNLSLGKPYGIQLGSINIGSNCFPQEFRRKQALDVVLVAHGMTLIKPAACWSQQDVDSILLLGTELHKETKDVSVDKLSQLTKGFTFKKQTIQVTMSEPIVVGKLSSITAHSVDLRLGLEKFFSQHQQGILQTTSLDFYISFKRLAFFVFDPHGRTMDCVRNISGEAALMVFACLDNVCHLIMNLSNADVKGPFKICNVEVTQLMDSKNSPEKFFATSGNPSSKPRSDDFKLLTLQIAYLQGSVHFNSKVFGTCGNKQQLTSSIMAIVYSKIDPPNSWSIAQLDRVLHFGTQMYRDFLQGEPTKNLTLLDIPSRFHVGNFYRVGITIAPFMKRVKLKKTRVSCDNPITEAFRTLYENSSFHCFLLQLGNNTFATWQMTSTGVFYFFDGQQKDIDGNYDHYEGSSTLFMTGKFDKLCGTIVKILMSQPQMGDATLEIHGMKIFELTKLCKKEQKFKKEFRVKRLDNIKPMTPEVAEKFGESPSTVDSVAPVLANKEIRMMRENILTTPTEHLKITKLNPPSLVCCKVENNQDEGEAPENASMFSSFTSNIVHTLYSEMFENIIEEEDAVVKSEKPKACDDDKNPCGAIKKDHGKFLGCAEKVWLKRDLRCSNQQKKAHDNRISNATDNNNSPNSSE